MSEYAAKLERLIKRQPPFTRADKDELWRLCEAFYRPEKRAATLSSIPVEDRVYFERALRFLQLRADSSGKLSAQSVDLLNNSYEHGIVIRRLSDGETFLCTAPGFRFIGGSREECEGAVEEYRNGQRNAA